jgi:hypothetical protein
MGAMTAAPARAAFQIGVTSAAAPAGHDAYLDIVLSGEGDAPVALTFTVEYDRRKLSMSPLTSATSSSPVTMFIPSSASFSVFPDDANGRIGIAIYPTAGPIHAIGPGRIARIRLLASREAEGFAFVHIAPSPIPSASTALEVMVPVGVDNSPTGVVLTSSRELLALSPAAIDFGEVPPGTTLQKRLIISNAWNASVTITGVSSSGDEAFSIQLAPPFPLTLAPDENTFVTLQLTAAEEGGVTGSVEVMTASGTILTVPLSAVVSRSASMFLPSRRLLPAVARLSNSDGSRWRSDLSAYNPRGIPSLIRLTYQPADGGSASTADITLAPHQSKHFSDVLGELFSSDATGSGPVIVEASSDEVDIRSSTNFDGPEGGTSTETIPLVRWENLLHTGEEAILPTLAFSAAKRSKVAVLNLSSAAAAFEIRLLRLDGSVAQTIGLTLPPHAMAGRVELFDGGPPPAELLTVVVEAISPSALFYAYGSTIDVRSGAPSYQPAR